MSAKASSPRRPPPPRKGAMRMADIPPDILKQLNAGEIETATLVEWLAIDQRVLVRSLSGDTELAKHRTQLEESAEASVALGIMQRMKAMGEALYAVLKKHNKREAVFERLITHRSDVVRGWAVYSVGADASLNLVDRLALVKRFAADSHMGVREFSWMTIRSFVAEDLARGLKLLKPWVKDRDFAVRRCAVEATRPRGVWCAHIEALKIDPSPGSGLLEPVRSDEADYVRRSVGNWLNDASKSNPEWVREVCARWRKESRTKETEAIVKRALRTVTKKK